MKFTDKQTSKIMRVKNTIENIQSCSNMEYSPLDIANLHDCYVDILFNRMTKTINEMVVDIFANCGFEVNKKGMEWIVRL